MSGRPLYSIMQGVPVKDGTKPKLVARSTARYVAPNGDVIIRLHRTNIITFSTAGIVLNSGGWQTVTTKERMNRFVFGLNLWSKRGEWRIGGGHEQYAYYDGIILSGMNARPIHDKLIPPPPPKPPRLTPSDANKWLRLLTQEPPQ